MKEKEKSVFFLGTLSEGRGAHRTWNGGSCGVCLRVFPRRGCTDSQTRTCAKTSCSCIYTCTVPREAVVCVCHVYGRVSAASIHALCQGRVQTSCFLPLYKRRVQEACFSRLNACTVNLLVSYVRSKRMHAIQHLHDLGRAHLLPAFRADADNVLNVLLR